MAPNATMLLTGLLSGAILIALVAIVGGFLHSRRERLLTHRERMKALELGRFMPHDPATARIRAAIETGSGGGTEDAQGSLARKCYSTALWIAFWGFIAAGQAGPTNPAVSIVIAGSVGAIGVAAMIGGTILASQARAEVTPQPGSVFKPAAEADEFDVVSSRQAVHAH
jgi:hypothetical protein